jgi:arsenite/tail-anchored protein-transporting ATPase
VRVLLLTGKGGVGKTSLSLATALGAAAHGHRVFVLSTDPAHSLGDALRRRLGGRPQPIAPGVTVQEVSVLEEMTRSWAEIQRFLRGLLRDEADELVAEELLTFPGLEELVSLRTIREVEATGAYDVCVVDCAPTGATLRMLRFPDVLRIFMENFFETKRRGARLLRPWLERVHAANLVPGEATFDAFERLYGDVDAVRAILLDDSRTSARLVVNPMRVVVDETRRSFAYLSLYGVATDAVLVNRVLPGAAAEGWFSRWAVREREELAAIEASFPVPQFRAPLYARELAGVADLERLARDLYGERDPAELFTRARPIRLRKHMGRPRLEIDLPGVAKEELEVAVHGPDLLVRVRDATRLVGLPGSVVGLALRRARLQDGVLTVDFS